MQQRPLGRTGRNVSAVGLGTWQLGADWGAVSEDDALAVLAASFSPNAGGNHPSRLAASPLPRSMVTPCPSIRASRW